VGKANNYAFLCKLLVGMRSSESCTVNGHRTGQRFSDCVQRKIVWLESDCEGSSVWDKIYCELSVIQIICICRLSKRLR